MLLRVWHRTRFTYDGPVSESHNEVRLKPLTDEHQTCRSFRLTTDPSANIRSYEEPGGEVHFFNARLPHTALEIVAEAEVETNLVNPFEAGEGGWDFYAQDGVRQDYAELLAPSRLAPHLPEAAEFATAARTKAGKDVPSFLAALNHILGDTLTYQPGATNVETRLEEFLRLRKGVCQDFAHLMLSACRGVGIPSRYVSGYLYAGDDPTRQGYGATHAWVECLLPGRVWRGYDPTNTLVANDHYVKAHWGRDYAGVPPVRGTYRGAPASSLCVEVRVEALSPDPE